MSEHGWPMIDFLNCYDGWDDPDYTCVCGEGFPDLDTLDKHLEEKADEED